MIDSRLPSGEPLQFVFEEITWQQELSWEEAARRLEVAMYPFKKVRPDGGKGQGWDPWGWVRSRGSSRWALGVGCRAGLAAEAASLWGPAWAGEPPLCPLELGGGIPWLSVTPSHRHTDTHTANIHAYVHTHVYTLQTHTTCTSHTQPLNGTLAAHDSFSLSRLGPRSPTCRSPRPLSEPRPRTSWCTQFCCGGPWTTSPAEVRETLPV